MQPRDAIGAQHGIRHVLLGERSQGMGGGQLHLFVDRPGANVQRAAENERESEDVIHLVGIIRPSRGHDDVLAGRTRLVISDLGIRIGHGEGNRVVGHGADHVLGDAVGHRKPHKDVRADEGVGERPLVGFPCEALLVRVHTRRATFVDDSLGVAQNDVFTLYAEPYIMLRAGDARGSRAVHDHPNFGDVLPGQFQRVHQGGAGDNGRAVLVVMEDGNGQCFPQFLFDVETLRGFDVLQVDAAERGLEKLAGLDDFIRVFGVHLQVEDVNISEALEEHSLAFHHRLARQRPDIAESQDGCAVRNHGHQVSARRVIKSQFGMLFDLQARLGHAGRVCQAQIPLGPAGLGGDDFDFALAAGRVIVKRVLFADFHVSSPD